MYGTYNADLDTTVHNAYFYDILDEAGYEVNIHLNDPPLSAYADLQTGDIFVSRGHGDPGKIRIYNESGAYLGCLAANPQVDSGISNQYVSNHTDGDLSRLRCVLYIGCSTGVDKVVSGVAYNLVEETFNKGAHFVLGTTESVHTDDSNDFFKGFLDAMDMGLSIRDCIEYAKRETGYAQCDAHDDEDGVQNTEDDRHKYPITYIGDETQVLAG